MYTDKAKLLLKFIKSIYLITRWGETADYVNSLQHMLIPFPSCYFSSLEGSGNYFELVCVLQQSVGQLVAQFSGRH